MVDLFSFQMLLFAIFYIIMACVTAFFYGVVAPRQTDNDELVLRLTDIMLKWPMILPVCFWLLGRNRRNR